MVENQIVGARQLRLAMIRNVFDQGLLSEADARELLAGPLTPDDPSTVYDDSGLLLIDAQQALQQIARMCNDLAR